MPLTHIQLRARERKAARAKPTPRRKPTLERRLVAGPGPAIAGGPSYRPQPPSPLATGALAKPYFRPGAGTLEEVLRAAKPVTGKGLDIQAQAWARRKEIVAEEQTKLDKEADALYDAVQDLSPEDQDFILSKVVGKAKPSGLAAALGAEPGAVSPTAVGTDPLMQTMIDKHYVRRDETGKYSWMLPMKEKKVTNVNTWTDEQGWLQQTTTFADGTSETELLGRAAKEEVTTGLTPSEQLGRARLQFDVEKAGAIHVSAAIKERGEAPISGVTIVKRPGGKDRKATDEDVAAYWQAIEADADYRRVSAEGIRSVDDAKIRYQYDTEAIKNVQRNIPGMTVDGKWSDELGQVLYDLFFKEE